jgi:hypothetical protein
VVVIIGDGGSASAVGYRDGAALRPAGHTAWNNSSWGPSFEEMPLLKAALIRST